MTQIEIRPSLIFTPKVSPKVYQEHFLEVGKQLVGLTKPHSKLGITPKKVGVKETKPFSPQPAIRYLQNSLPTNLIGRISE